MMLFNISQGFFAFSLHIQVCIFKFKPSFVAGLHDFFFRYIKFSADFLIHTFDNMVDIIKREEWIHKCNLIVF